MIEIHRNGAKPMIHFVLGGARSGKSAFAETLALSKRQPSGRLIYVATAQIFDDEMRDRISLHQDRRGPEWELCEAPIDLGAALAEHDAANNVLLVDCLSVWTTNLLIGEHDIPTIRDALCTQLESLQSTIIFVASETGLGIVPDNALSRRFRDESGLVNQSVAAIANEVFFVTAGIATKIKP